MTIGLRSRRLVALSLTGLLLSGAAVLGGPSAQAADNGAWSVAPKTVGEFTPRQFFFFEAATGQTIRDAVTITNAAETPLPLSVYPADAFNIEAGAGFGLREKGKPNNDVGSWIKVSRDQVTVPPNGSVSVPFTMTVPRGATPGDHAGGVVTLEAAPAPQGDSSQIQIQRALGVRVYVRVAGPLTPALVVQSVKLDITPARLPFVGKQGGATVTYTVRNTGNVRLTATRLITLKGLLGRTLHETPREPIPEILPGSTVTLTESFAGMPVLDQVTARVELTEEQQDVQTAGDTTGWSVSWVFLFLLVLIIVGIGLAVWWSRRDPSVGRSGGDDDGPADPSGPSGDPEPAGVGQP